MQLGSSTAAETYDPPVVLLLGRHGELGLIPHSLFRCSRYNTPQFLCLSLVASRLRQALEFLLSLKTMPFYGILYFLFFKLLQLIIRAPPRIVVNALIVQSGDARSAPIVKRILLRARGTDVSE